MLHLTHNDQLKALVKDSFFSRVIKMTKVNGAYLVESEGSKGLLNN